MTSRRSLTAALALTLSLATAAPVLAATTPAAATPTAVSTSGGSTSGGSADPRDEAVLQQLEELLETAQLPALVEGSDYACSGTPLGAWRNAQMKGWTTSEKDFARTAEVLVRAEALIFQPDGPQHFGVNGEYTKELDKTLGTLRSFWDVEGSDVRMGAVHGSVLLDDDRMQRLFMALGQSPAQATGTVRFFQDQLRNPTFENGDHPVFSMTAFAHSDAGRVAQGLPDKILIGDGLLEGMEAVGLGDVAPRGILAHEYGHQVQYELRLMNSYNLSPEATRELELEADALAGYYLSHPRGERLRQQRVDAFVRSFGETGDCNFTSNGHHGTPSQRSASALWGDELANAKGAKGHVLPARTVSDRFRVALPGILAPDAR